MTQPISSRRRSGSVAVAGARQPALALPAITSGDTTISNKILVACASRAGSTRGVAEAISQTLAESGAPVEVRRMQDVQDLAPYRAVVAGSAVRGAKWLPEAMQFMETHQAALARKPFAAFLVCITLAMPNGATDQYRQFVADFLKPVRAMVQPVSEGVFAGTLNYGQLPLIPEGLQMRFLSMATRTPEGDYRDWSAIRDWASDLVVKLALSLSH
jgi:menaquinone-dependent protoporphyrinogen oxidase